MTTQPGINPHATSAAVSPRPEWDAAKRIVIKIGSALLVDTETGQLKRDWLSSLLDDISALRKRGVDVVLVSSGAIGLGRHALHLPAGALSLEDSQAAAAVGQINLAHAYRDLAAVHDIQIAQILVTLQDTEQRRRYLNARQTIDTLLRLNALPVVNENDTVATNEIRYGDNDRLSARVASMTSADCLILLSDVDGFYSAPPDSSSDGKRFDVISEITPEIEAMAGDAGTALSKGGMKTKLEAARVATSAGCHMVIASGLIANPLRAIGEGAPCTWFLAPSDPVTAKKRWLSGQLDPLGDVTVDEGAKRALQSGKSLLPAGVVTVSGCFDRGDAVIVRDQSGVELGRGLIAYAHRDAVRIIGKQSHEIAEILGFEGRAALIHRDDLALIRR
ncbi:MAG: glutamate 5-kinase [Pseudomonadota bacterium]